jgi:hypothetical protein
MSGITSPRSHERSLAGWSGSAAATGDDGGSPDAVTVGPPGSREGPALGHGSPAPGSGKRARSMARMVASSADSSTVGPAGAGVPAMMRRVASSGWPGSLPALRGAFLPPPVAFLGGAAFAGAALVALVGFAAEGGFASLEASFAASFAAALGAAGEPAWAAASGAKPKATPRASAASTPAERARSGLIRAGLSHAPPGGSTSRPAGNGSPSPRKRRLRPPRFG